MGISEVPVGVWNWGSFKFSDANISKGWRITRNVAGGIFVISSFLSGPASPIVLGALVIKWLGLISIVSGVVAGVAQGDTSKVKK